MSGETTEVKFKRSALDNTKLNLLTVNEEGTDARLIFGFINNAPRVTVFTNVKSDNKPETGNGRISANMDIPTFYMFLKDVEEIANGPNDVKIYYENYGHIYLNNERSEQPSVISELWVGKDNVGMVWMSVTAEGRPNLKFEFKLGSYHRIYKEGKAISKSNESKEVALAMVSAFRNIYSNVAISEYVDVAALKREIKNADTGEKKSYNSNNDGGGYNKGYNNNGGYNKNNGGYNRNNGGGYNKGYNNNSGGYNNRSNETESENTDF